MVVAGPEEMVEAGLEEVGHAGVTGDMAAEFAVGLIRAHHHHQRVPAHDRRQPLLYRQIAGEGGLALDRYAVDIGRAQLGMPVQSLGAGQSHQFVEQKAGTLRPLGAEHRHERLAPLQRFLGVGVCVGS